MESDGVKKIQMLSKATIASVKRLREINARALERLAQHQINVTSAYIKGNMKQFQKLSGAKSARDVISGQSTVIGELSGALLSHAKQTVDILTETRDEFRSWVQEGMKTVGESPLSKGLAGTATT